MSIEEKRHRIRTARTITRLTVVLIVFLGIAFSAGFGTLCAVGADVIVALCPLGALESLLAAKLAIPQLLVYAICVLVVVALFGRAFCSWVCPVPPIQKFFRSDNAKKHNEQEAPVSPDEQIAETGKLSANDYHPDACVHDCSACLAPVGGERDGVHLDSRHAVLAGALASSAVFGFPVFCLVCPVGLTFATLVAVWRTFVEHEPTWMLLVFPIILLLELVVFRKWCRTLCPLGALMSLIGAKAPLGRPRVQSDVCLRTRGVDCRTCVSACPIKLDPHSPTLPECTRCGVCIEACPAQAIRLKSK